MSTTTTPNFGLILPTPGTAEPIDLSQINANWTLIDTLARSISCTSSTQPSAPFPGEMIFETDTLKLRRRNDANSSWVTVSCLAVTTTSASPPASPTAGQTYWESDTGSLVVRNNGGTWQHTGIPAVASTASIVAPRTGQVVFVTTGNTLMRYTGGAWAVYSVFTHSGTATVSASETTTSTAYTDLATPGPAVTITSVGTLALVLFAGRQFAAAAAGSAMSVAVSGATTVAASDAFAFCSTHDNSGLGFRGMSFAQFTITPGSNTYTAKYRVTASTGTFVDRRIWVYAP